MKIRVLIFYCNYRSVLRHGSESDRPDSGFDSNRDAEEREDETGATAANNNDHSQVISQSISCTG